MNLYNSGGGQGRKPFYGPVNEDDIESTNGAAFDGGQVGLTAQGGNAGTEVPGTDFASGGAKKPSLGDAFKQPQQKDVDLSPQGGTSGLPSLWHVMQPRA